MGALVSRVKRLFAKKKGRVLLLGLDNAGKTSVLNALVGKQRETVPTISFNVEQVLIGKTEFFVWDVSGQDQGRRLWRHYYHGTTGVIFVVDSSDEERMRNVHDELHSLLVEEELKDTTYLILANKQDMPHALSAGDVAKRLNIEALGDRVHVAATVAKTGVGLKPAVKWLAQNMASL